MDLFTNGQLKPPDDPEMGTPIIDPSEPKDATEGDENQADKKDGTEKVQKSANVDLDEFKDRSGLHYKQGLRLTSQTPNPPELHNSSRQFGAIADLGANKY